MALTNEDLQAIAELFKPMQRDISDMQRNINDMQKDINDMHGDINDMKKDINDMQKDINDMQKDINDMQRDINDMQRDINDIQLTLEQETNRNIKLIAEGHLDLNRKLDNALKVENEKEMLLIRVNHLENELRKVKDRLNQIA